MIITERSLFYLIVVTLFTSCGTAFQGPHKSEVKKIDQSFSGTFYNIPFKTKHSNSKRVSLCYLLGIRDFEADTLKLNINSEGFLYVSFYQGSSPVTIILKGKFKKGYYEYFLSKKRTGVPLFYNRSDIKRIRIGLTNDNSLIIDYYWDVGATRWVLFASGSTGRGQYYFKKI